MARLSVPLLSVSALTASLLVVAPFDATITRRTGPALSSPGVVYEIEITDHNASPPTTDSIQTKIEGRNLKLTFAARGQYGSRGEMIFRGDRMEMVMVDHDNKSYMVIDSATLAQMAKQFGAARKQMDDMLARLPEKQRAQMEKQMRLGGMPGMGAPKKQARLVNTGEEATKGGYPCVKYEVWRGDRKLREIWVTGWKRIPGGDEAAGAYEAMADFFTGMLDEMGGGPFAAGADQYRFMKDMNGFPIVTREFGDDGNLDTESTLLSAKRQTIDPAEFEPPSGYKRQEMGGR